MTLFFWFMEYLASFLEGYMCCIFCGTFLTNDRVESRKYLAFLLSGVEAAMVIILNQMQLFSFFNVAIVILLCTIMQLLLYKKKLGLTVALTLVYIVILTAIDFTIAFLTALVLDTSAGYTLNMQSFKRVVCILFSKSILTFIIITINKICRNTIVLIKKYALIMCIYSIFLLVVLFVMVELNMDGKRPEIDFFLMFFFMLSITIELLMFHFIIKMGESYEQKQRVELIEMQNSMLQKSLSETESAFQLWRKSVHDYKNNIIALTQLAEDGNIEEIKKYLQNEKALINRKMFYIRTGNSVVDAIVNTKQNYAENQGITFAVNAAIPEDCKINDMDFANILGNLIDNAIEASIGESNAYIDLTIRQEKKFIVIKIANKYSKELPKKMKSTKEDKIFHGIGIGSVKSIVQKYNGEFSMIKKNDEVVAKILLLNKDFGVKTL